MAAATKNSLVRGRLGRAGPSESELDLLRAAVLPADDAVSAWRRWVATHAIDDTAGYAVEVLPAVSANLPAAALGAEAERLRGLRRRAWVEHQHRLESTLPTLDALASLGVTPIATGGAVLSSTVYPVAGTRPWGLLDLVVGGTDLDHVDDALVALRSEADGAAAHVRLHAWLLFPAVVAVPERRWVQRSVCHDVAGRTIRRLRLADELVAAVVGGLWSPSGAAARWPLDVVHLARHAPTVDQVAPDEFWRELVASANEVGVGPLLADGLELCRSELDAPVPAVVVAELSSGSLDRHVARHMAARRHGITPPWRVLRYRRLCRDKGERPTAFGYVHRRYATLAAKGVVASVGDRTAAAAAYVGSRRGS